MCSCAPAGVEKAIEKAKGTGGEDYAEARYEGFGPGNCMVIIDCLTDNGNRTIKDVRQCFTKTHSKIGSSGTVSHMFDHQAVFAFKGDDDETDDCDSVVCRNDRTRLRGGRGIGEAAARA